MKKNAAGAFDPKANLVQDARNPGLDIRTTVICCAVLFTLCLAAHGYSLWNGFCHGDYFALQPFAGVETKKWNEFWMQLFTQGFLHPFESPLTTLSLAIDFQSVRWSAPAYHAINLFLHVFSVIAAYLFIVRLTRYLEVGRNLVSTKNIWYVSFVAAALLAVHPLGSDSVAHIVGRGAMITFFWYFTGLHSFLTGFMAKSVWRGLFGYLGAYLCIVMAAFSSCQAISLPITMIFVGLLLKPAQGYAWKDWLYERAWEFGALAFAAIALPFLFLLDSTMPVGAGLGFAPLSSVSYFATQFKALFTYYLRTFIAPFGFTIAPTFAIASSFSDPLAIAGILTVVASVAAMFVYRKKPLLVFGLYLFLVGLIPQGLVPQSEYASSERFYFSCFGLSLALASVVCLIPLALTTTRRAAVAFALVLVTLIGLSNWRDRAYATNSALVRGALRLDPGNASLRALLAFLLSTDGGINVERGYIEADRALEQNRDLALAYIGRGNFLSWKKSRSETIDAFKKGLKLAEEQKLSKEVVLTAKSGLAQALSDGDCIDDPLYVQELARSALTMYPSKARLHLALGKALLAENKPESAELACRQFDKGRHFDSLDVDFALPYVVAALNTGYPFRFEIAYGAARTASKIVAQPDLKVLFARAALETGRIRKGLALMQEYFIEVPRPSADAYRVTGGLAQQLGDKESASRYYARARKEDPGVDKRVRLYLTVPPKAAKEDDNVGPDKLPSAGLTGIQERSKRNILKEFSK
jgi:tetratricopeptide (TPR) repeat protein